MRTMIPGLPSSGTQQAAAMIPYENFKGAVLGNQYQLQYFKVQDGHLDIYVVTNLRPRPLGSDDRRHGMFQDQKPGPGYSHDEVLEAKAFPLSCSCALGHESHARRRRIKRICRSQNFRDEVEQSGKRFLISHVQRSEAEWNSLSRPVPPTKSVQRHHQPQPVSFTRRDPFADVSSLECCLDANDNDTPFSDMESTAGCSSDPYSRPSSRTSTIFSASTPVSTPPASPTPSWAKIAALNTVTSLPATTTQARQSGVEMVTNPQHRHEQGHHQLRREPPTAPELASSPSYAQALADGLPKRTSTKHGVRQARCRQRWREERRLQVMQSGP